MGLSSWSKGMNIYKHAYTWTMLFSNLYIHLFLIFIFYHGLCAKGYEAIDGMGVGSTSEFILNNVINIMNSTVVDASCYYGLELIES